MKGCWSVIFKLGYLSTRESNLLLYGLPRPRNGHLGGTVKADRRMFVDTIVFRVGDRLREEGGWTLPLYPITNDTTHNDVT